MAGGVAKVNVGAATESEMKEKKARVEDALHATRAASKKEFCLVVELLFYVRRLKSRQRKR